MNSHNYRSIFLAIIWLLVSISLGVWWTIMGLRHTILISSLKEEIGKEKEEERMEILRRQSTMIKFEGAFFLSLITVGGLTLIYLSYRDSKKNKMLKEFFTTLTHEMKTPLASLRLQVESLSEDIKDPDQKQILQRLLNDTQRVELQMNKALYLASLTRSEILFLENVDIKDLLLSLQSEYTILKIESPERLILKIDRRATKSILENLIENSRHHGGATQVIITAIKKNDYAKIVVYDNGKGFQGNPKNLGKPFFRHSTTSGSGIGLYLIKSLIEKMKGEFHLNNLKNGFEIEIHLPIAEPG